MKTVNKSTYQKAQHAPGPWMIKQPGEHGKGLRVVHEIRKGVLYGGVCDILTMRCSSDNFSDATEQANARLIAAAPELLEACQIAIEGWEECRRDLEKVLGFKEHSFNRWEKVQFIRGAIAKAKGGGK